MAIVKVRIVREGVSATSPGRIPLVYRSGPIPEEQLRDFPYVVVPIRSVRHLGQIVEVARTRRGLSGRVYTGDLRTVDRLANATEIRIARDIERATDTINRAKARRLNKHRSLRALLNR